MIDRQTDRQTDGERTLLSCNGRPDTNAVSRHSAKYMYRAKERHSFIIALIVMIAKEGGLVD